MSQAVVDLLEVVQVQEHYRELLFLTPCDGDGAVELFEQHGTVETVNVVTDRDTGRPRGFAFVEMGSEEEARKAIAEVGGKEFGFSELEMWAIL